MWDTGRSGKDDQVRQGTTATGRRASRTSTASPGRTWATTTPACCSSRADRSRSTSSRRSARSSKLQKTAGVTMKLFPSTRTDYVLFNQKFKPLRRTCTCAARCPTRSTARRSSRRSCSATARLPTRSCRRRCRTTTRSRRASSTTSPRPRRSWPSPTVPDGFTVDVRCVGSGALDQQTDRARSCRQPLKPLGINDQHPQEGRQRTGSSPIWQNANYPGMNNSYWTMDIADPDELVTFAVDPSQGAHSFQTWYNNPVIEGGPAGRPRVRSQEAPGALLEDAAHRGRGRVHGVPLLLAVPLRVLEQGQGIPGVSAPAITTWRTSGCRSSRRLARAGTSVDRLAYVLRRLAQVVPVVLGVTMLTFLLVHLLPGDPAGAVLGNRATPERVAQLHAQVGPRPLAARAVRDVHGAARARRPRRVAALRRRRRAR